MVQNYTLFIPALPFLAFAIIVLLTRKSNRLSALVAITGVVAALVLSYGVFVEALSEGAELSLNPFYGAPIVWAPYGGMSFNFGWYVDPIGAAMLFMVPTVCLMIFIYSTAYMRHSHVDEHGHHHNEDDPRYARFFAYISLFTAMMLLLVISSNLLEFFIAWEIMGFCSYALIGFWSFRGRKEHHIDDAQVGRARAASIKAFLTTRVGDVLLMTGIILLLLTVGTLDFTKMYDPQVMNNMLSATTQPLPGVEWPVLIALLIFCGTIGKSAQFPLHIWLPDAMEGPTPVSALIHAATMVSAGIFLVIRTYPLLTFAQETGGAAMQVVAIVGAFTALFAATMGLAQNDIKRVLAYSTISQLGYMLAALGIGAFVAGSFHLITHAFFKALLFLGAGAVIHAVGTNDMFKMGGLWRKMPITFVTFFIGAFALMGFFPLSGFWSKDEILLEALRGGYFPHEGGQDIFLQVIYLMLAVGAFITALYTGRQIFLTFFGKPRDPEAYEQAHEAPAAMWAPLAVLATFTVFLGFWNSPFAPAFFHFVGETGFMGMGPFEHVEFDQIALSNAFLSVGIALSGFIAAWAIYGFRSVKAGQSDPLAHLGIIWKMLSSKYWLDELYGYKINLDGTAKPGLLIRLVGLVMRFLWWFERAIVDGLVNLAGWFTRLLARLWGWVDSHIVDGLVNATGSVTGEIAGWWRTMQTGNVQNYALVAVAGAMALAILFLLRSFT
ncbi:MAG: NADH-quinone oxidoreductase subunit L [Anaerolineae bacterium]|nr:NADH-quinone oxidoreductase subunit L [Anaerolineae bacterium]RIK34344.1 MAG: NADH-quinone oxidoreductase subunit L [Chloroflexota bacterium]